MAAALSPAEMRPYAGVTGFPFLVIAVVAFKRQWNLPTARQVEIVTEIVSGLGWESFRGLLEQAFARDGWQVEITNKWLKAGWPWEIPHPDQACFVGVGGHTETFRDEHGKLRSRWIPAEHAIGIPHDVPVLGYRVNTCDRLRLWRADATESFDFYAFNIGDYYGAVEEKVGSETLSKVLYPNDEPEVGKQLRLLQQYFFVSCSLQDILRRFKARHDNLRDLPKYVAIQMNDTHPAIAGPELIRLLVDENGMGFDDALETARGCLGYTNHTLLPEALERWATFTFGNVLPRHMQIVYAINSRVLREARKSGTPTMTGTLVGTPQTLGSVSVALGVFDPRNLPVAVVLAAGVSPGIRPDAMS